MGEVADDKEPAKYTNDCADTRLEGKREEEETDQMGGTPPLDSLGSLTTTACYECGNLLACKTHICACQKAGSHCNE